MEELGGLAIQEKFPVRGTPPRLIMRAIPEDSAVLSEIAFAAKSYWGYPAEWMAAWREVFIITPEFVRDHPVYKALSKTDNGQMDITGFYALVGTGHTLTLEHLWVRPEFIGQGVGRDLFRYAVVEAKTIGAKRIELEADPNAEGFYLHMGARRIGVRRADIDDRPRIVPRMALEIN